MSNQPQKPVRFRIRHVTHYSFDQPVFLEPHVIRLTPRRDGYFLPLRHELTIEPTPSGTSVGLDASGNTFYSVWFSGLTDTLRIISESEGDALRHNPFDYLIENSIQGLPPNYSPKERAALADSLSPESDSAVGRFAERIIRSLDSDTPLTLDFLATLTTTLNNEHTSIVRPDGDPFDPRTTLETREVSCRDVAVLFIAVCRNQGIAARFVSGYQAGDPHQGDRDLHAWVEAYLPGAGWRAYDPTLGLIVADQHVAVAAAAHWAEAAPVVGSFRGSGVRSRLHSIIYLTTDGLPHPPTKESREPPSGSETTD